MPPLWQTALLCAAFFVVGFLACALMVVICRERVLDRHVEACEREIYAPFLQAGDVPAVHRGQPVAYAQRARHRIEDY